MGDDWAANTRLPARELHAGSAVACTRLTGVHLAACTGSQTELVGALCRAQEHAERREAQLERARQQGGSASASDAEGGSDARVSVIPRPTRLT